MSGRGGVGWRRVRRAPEILGKRALHQRLQQFHHAWHLPARADRAAGERTGRLGSGQGGLGADRAAGERTGQLGSGQGGWGADRAARERTGQLGSEQRGRLGSRQGSWGADRAARERTGQLISPYPHNRISHLARWGGELARVSARMRAPSFDFAFRLAPVPRLSVGFHAIPCAFACFRVLAYLCLFVLICTYLCLFVLICAQLCLFVLVCACLCFVVRMCVCASLCFSALFGHAASPFLCAAERSGAGAPW